MGRPGLHRRAVAASAVVMLIAIYPACKLLGVVGGQVAALLAIIVSYLTSMPCGGSRAWICFAMEKHLSRRFWCPGEFLASVWALAFLAGQDRSPISLLSPPLCYSLCLCVPPAFLKIKQAA